MKKLINIILCIAITVIISILPCFASTSGYDANIFSTISPQAIILHSYDDIFIANNQRYNTVETTEIYTDAYTIYIQEVGENLIWYEADGYSFDGVTLDYGAFYTDVYGGTLPIEYIDIVILEDISVNAYVDYTVTYYLGDGSKMEMSYTDNYSFTDGNVGINIRDYAEIEFARDGFISSFVVRLDFSDNINAFGVSNYDASDAGIVLGNRIFNNIEVTQNIVNPNILGWLTESMNSFMGARIFGDITIGAIIAFALAVPMVTWFLKLVSGG